MVLRSLPPPETEGPVEVVVPEDEGSLELIPATPEDSPAPSEPVEPEDEGPTQEQVMPTSSYPLHQQANNKSVQCPVGTLNNGLSFMQPPTDHPIPANKSNAC